MSMLSDLWGDITGGNARAAAQDQLTYTQGVNQQNLTAAEKANQQTLDANKVMAFLQMLQGNQSNAGIQASNLMNQQNSLNQYAQLYNQQQQNALPVQMAQLAGLQAMTPLMQLAGMQGYQMPTTINTTPLQAPNLLSQYTGLRDMFQQQGAKDMDPGMVLSALSNPAAFLNQSGVTPSNSGGVQTSGQGLLEALNQYLTSTGKQPIGTNAAQPTGTTGTTGTPQAAPWTYFANGASGGPPSSLSANMLAAPGSPGSSIPTQLGADGQITYQGTAPKTTAPDAMGRTQQVPGQYFTKDQYIATYGIDPTTGQVPGMSTTPGGQIPSTKVPPGADPAVIKQILDAYSMTMTGQPSQHQPKSTNQATTYNQNAVSNTLTQMPGQTTQGLTPSTSPVANFKESPEYLFRLQQAQRELANQMSARGLSGGGAQTQNATDLAMRLSGEEADKQYQKYMDLVKLGMGMQPTNSTSVASGMAQTYQQGGQNTAEALQNAANQRSGMYSNLANAYGNNAQSNANAYSQANLANAGALGSYNQANANAGSTFGNLFNLGTKLYSLGSGAGWFGGGAGAASAWPQ